MFDPDGAVGVRFPLGDDDGGLDLDLPGAAIEVHVVHIEPAQRSLERLEHAVQRHAEHLLERHGVVTRGAVTAEHVEGGFARLADVEAGDQVLVERTDGVHAHHSGAEHHHQRRAGHRHRGALLSTDEHCLTLSTTDR